MIVRGRAPKFGGKNDYYTSFVFQVFNSVEEWKIVDENIIGAP